MYTNQWLQSNLKFVYTLNSKILTKYIKRYSLLETITIYIYYATALGVQQRILCLWWSFSQNQKANFLKNVFCNFTEKRLTLGFGMSNIKFGSTNQKIDSFLKELKNT